MRALDKPKATRLRVGLPLLLTLALAGAVHAADADPPARVARLAQVLGEVSIEPAGLDDWAAAEVNRPLTTGDKLWSDADSRVELTIGSALIRVASATGFSFLNLDDHTAQMQLSAGTVSVHVRYMGENETLEVDTPNIAVALLGPGDYRIDVNDAGDTSVVKVSGGTAEVAAGGEDFPIHLQQQMTFTGTAVVAAVAASLGSPDDFDAWTFERDRRARIVQTTNYVSAEVVGADDLDENGTWQSTPDEGYAWAPNSVPVGWAPYHNGHWIWIAPWGWTWIDAAPWGFAPFHYGRWATCGGRWCWLPGTARTRAVYAPALVVWVGGPPVAARAEVAWFALGPHEIYVPAYPVSQSYVRNINLASTSVNSAYLTNAYNHNAASVRYLNRTAPGAITTVTQATFTGALPVAPNALHPAPNELAAAALSMTTPPITPLRQSVLGAEPAGRVVHRPPPFLRNRLVVVKTAPPRAPPPFAAEQEAIRANGGRPLARSELTALSFYAPATRVRSALPAPAAERSGMTRAARPNPVAPPVETTEAAPALTHQDMPAVAPRASMTRAALAAPGSAAPLMRSDRPPGASGQPGAENRVEAGRALLPEPARQVERPVAKPGPLPLAAAPPPEVVPPAATESKPKPAVHADKTVHPAARINN